MQQQEYVKKVQEVYAPRETTKLEELKKLDAKVKRPANIFAYTFGTLGALVLGTGMCFAMKVIGDLMPLGIAIGCVGIAMVTANYFIYKAILKARKKKYGPSVLALTDEILHKEEA